MTGMRSLLALSMLELSLLSGICLQGGAPPVSPMNEAGNESVHKVYKEMYEFRQLLAKLEPSIKYLKTMFTTKSPGVSGMFFSKSILKMLKQSVVWEFEHFPYERVEGSLKTKTVKNIVHLFHQDLSMAPLFELWRELKRLEVVSGETEKHTLDVVTPHRHKSIINLGDFPASCENTNNPCIKIPSYLTIARDLSLLVTVLQEFIVWRTKERLFTSRLNRNNLITRSEIRSDQILSTIDAISQLPIAEMIDSAFRAVELFSDLLEVIQQSSGLSFKEWLMKECLNEFPLAVYVVIVNTMKVMGDRSVRNSL